MQTLLPDGLMMCVLSAVGAIAKAMRFGPGINVGAWTMSRHDRLPHRVNTMAGSNRPGLSPLLDGSDPLPCREPDDSRENDYAPAPLGDRIY
jgi:hypothetical protein